MKLILTQEVSGLGSPGDIVEVKDGFGRNYLIPRGFAMRWTKGGEKQVAMIRRGREVREIRDHGEAEQVAAELARLAVDLPTRAGEGGRLFGSVTAGDIADAVKAAGGPKIDKRRIQLDSPIKTVGEHRVSVRLHPEVTGHLSVNVVPA